MAKKIKKQKNVIQRFIHCEKCMYELPDGQSPRDYAQLEVGLTSFDGLNADHVQIWCKRHEQHVGFIPLQAKPIGLPACGGCDEC